MRYWIVLLILTTTRRMNMRLRTLLLLIVLAFLPGCVMLFPEDYTPQVLGPAPYGKDIYLVTVSKTHGRALRYGPGLVMAADAGGKFCAAKGKTMAPVDQPLIRTKETGIAGNTTGALQQRNLLSGSSGSVDAPGHLEHYVAKKAKSEVTLLFRCE